jgi:NAD(P)-dependent dehydrogenase (short-subunit alcohol dehydrogenase family)
MGSMYGRTALVTGATSGIGRADLAGISADASLWTDASDECLPATVDAVPWSP